MKKSEYIELLQSGVYSIKFAKEDGSERIMRGTLLTEYLPQKETVHGDHVNVKVDKSGVRTEQGSVSGSDDLNSGVVKLWDVDAKGWRSFRTESVKEFQPQLLQE